MYFLISKSADEISAKFQAYQAWIKARGFGIKRLRCDNGTGEYNNSLFLEILRENGITYEPSLLHPKYYRVGIRIRTRQEGIGNSSHSLRTAYRDRATDNVGARLGSTDSAAPDDPGPSTGAGRESASAAAEKDNLGGHHMDKLSEGNGNARSCESRSWDRSGVVSRGTAPRGTTPRVGNRDIIADGQRPEAIPLHPVVRRHEESCYHSHPRH